MNQLLATNSRNWPAFIARLALGLTIAPHGAQKLFKVFGGYGFQGTMGFLTGVQGLPYLVALLVILIESVGALMLIFGLLTRVAALGMFGMFAIIMFKFHWSNGFFMNWAMVGGKGEGFEYFIMVLGLALVLLISGGGAASIDAALTSKKRTLNSASSRA